MSAASKATDARGSTVPLGCGSGRSVSFTSHLAIGSTATRTSAPTRRPTGACGPSTGGWTPSFASCVISVRRRPVTKPSVSNRSLLSRTFAGRSTPVVSSGAAFRPRPSGGGRTSALSSIGSSSRPSTWRRGGSSWRGARRSGVRMRSNSNDARSRGCRSRWRSFALTTAPPRTGKYCRGQ